MIDPRRWGSFAVLLLAGLLLQPGCVYSLGASKVRSQLERHACKSGYVLLVFSGLEAQRRAYLQQLGLATVASRNPVRRKLERQLDKLSRQLGQLKQKRVRLMARREQILPLFRGRGEIRSTDARWHRLNPLLEDYQQLAEQLSRDANKFTETITAFDELASGIRGAPACLPELPDPAKLSLDAHGTSCL